MTDFPLEHTLAQANTRLWNESPATEWLAAFPIGNGQIGGMVFGGIRSERIGLNHERLWRGVTRNRETPNVADRLDEIRDAFFSGEMALGAELAESILGGSQRRIMPYQPVGDLHITDLNTPETPDQYERELDLVTGVSSTTWHAGEIVNRRLAFVSAGHNALVVQLDTTSPQGLNLDIAVNRRHEDDEPGGPESNWAAPQEITLTSWSRQHRAGIHGVFTEGISFATEMRVVAHEGSISALDHEAARVSVREARSVTIVLGIMVKTEPHLMNSRDAIASHLDAVPTRFERLLEDHLVEHVPVMERVSLELPTPAEAAILPLSERLARLRTGEHDPGLSALYFHYGRYLLFSASRRCREPANLQGIWARN